MNTLGLFHPPLLRHTTGVGSRSRALTILHLFAFLLPVFRIVSTSSFAPYLFLMPLFYSFGGDNGAFLETASVAALLWTKKQRVRRWALLTFSVTQPTHNTDVIPPFLIFNDAVDENLFYKGVDKTAVAAARLHQHTTPTTTGIDGEAEFNPEKDDEELPPFPFKTGADLLALTKKHNVRRWSPLFPASRKYISLLVRA
jgi:hypothetical protein